MLKWAFRIVFTVSIVLLALFSVYQFFQIGELQNIIETSIGDLENANQDDVSILERVTTVEKKLGTQDSNSQSITERIDKIEESLGEKRNPHLPIVNRYLPNKDKTIWESIEEINDEIGISLKSQTIWQDINDHESRIYKLESTS